jgi:hypothetical protein
MLLAPTPDLVSMLRVSLRLFVENGEDMLFREKTSENKTINHTRK